MCIRDRAPKGGSKGTPADHIGLSVPNLQQTLDAVKANGFRVVTAEESPASYNVKGEIASPGSGVQLAFILGPDDVKVELIETRNQPERVKLHHIHFFGEQNAAMRDWYAKVFGAASQPGGPNAAFLTATLPGVRLQFSPSAAPVVPTAGRAVDHLSLIHI